MQFSVEFHDDCHISWGFSNELTTSYCTGVAPSLVCWGLVPLPCLAEDGQLGVVGVAGSPRAPRVGVACLTRPGERIESIYTL
jgi:hypothetical protein